tara:strand:- start:319 stop:561 length:243 start_codon:yes stop_codon:yes gene_type:complete
MKKKQARNIIIIITILLLIYLYIKNNIADYKPPNMGVPCFAHECGGMQPVGSEPKVCPSHCKCGAEDPMMPDAPRKCEDI